MTMNGDMFDFGNMVSKLGSNPFEEKTKWASDNRFYTLPKNEKGEGSAVIAFLPDPERRPLIRLYKINTTIIKDGQRRFCNEWSPTTINQPCPFQEAWQKLYNAGEREESRKFARSTRYVANIIVLKDPLQPENEGKVFLYDMSQKFKDKLEQAVNPSQQDVALSVERREIFNPTRGRVMRLLARKQSNDMVSYDSSEFVKQDPIWADPQVAYDNIVAKCYKLSDFLKPEAYKSYDELKQEFDRVTFANGPAPKSSNSEVLEAVAAPTKTSTPSASDSELDDLLKGLV